MKSDIKKDIVESKQVLRCSYSSCNFFFIPKHTISHTQYKISTTSSYVYFVSHSPNISRTEHRYFSGLFEHRLIPLPVMRWAQIYNNNNAMCILWNTILMPSNRTLLAHKHALFSLHHHTHADIQYNIHFRNIYIEFLFLVAPAHWVSEFLPLLCVNRTYKHTIDGDNRDDDDHDNDDDDDGLKERAPTSQNKLTRIFNSVLGHIPWRIQEHI